MLFLIESVVLCIVFTAIVIPAALKDPLQQLFNYPTAIRERVKSLPEYKDRIPTNKKKLSIKITAGIIFIVFLAGIAYFSGARGFVPAFLYVFGLWMVVNWYDTIILDIVIFCHDKKFRIPGTEDMAKEYENPWYHIIAGIRGTVIGAAGSALAAGLVWLAGLVRLAG
jgi:hypothetical protein